MKILIVNKFLYANGGSEIYIFELGKELIRQGHEVQYFGMEHPDRCVGNKVDAYTSNMDFHSGKMGKLLYPFRIVYSTEARRKIRLVLDDMQPDVVHLNNINFQLTPSIILEIDKWRKQTGKKCKIVSTIHDPQWVCPNHMLINGKTAKGCTACLHGNYMHCVNGRCIHGSLMKSILGTVEAYLYKAFHTYKLVDTILCPSYFMKNTMDSNPDLLGRTLMLRNFLNVSVPTSEQVSSFKKKNGLNQYVLYLGRYSAEKGIHTLVNAARLLPEIDFVFAGNGPFEKEVNAISNIKNLGFVTGVDKECLIAGAEFSLIASECYENCPFTVMESLTLNTPVVGADIGGIPELIEKGTTGDLFISGDAESLSGAIKTFWDDAEKVKEYRDNCDSVGYMGIQEYTETLCNSIYI